MSPTKQRLCPVWSVRPPRAAPAAEYWPVLFFEAHAGRGQIGGVDQADRTLLPPILIDHGLEQLRMDATQAGDAQAGPELVQAAHPGHLSLAAQAGELSPGALLRQHLDQEIQGMNRREQTQQMHPIELSGGVLAASPARDRFGPAVIDEIVGNERSQQFEKLSGAGRRKLRVHAPKRAS